MSETSRLELESRLLRALLHVLQLHGGELPVSVAGDELRRRHAKIWRDWKSKVPDSSLLRLCSTPTSKEHGISLGNLESLDKKAVSCGREPVICLERLSSEGSDGRIAPDKELATEGTLGTQEQSQFLLTALASRFERHPQASEIGALPLSWLTIALEKELLRHIRYCGTLQQVLSTGSSY